MRCFRLRLLVPNRNGFHLLWLFGNLCEDVSPINIMQCVAEVLFAVVLSETYSLLFISSYLVVKTERGVKRHYLVRAVFVSFAAVACMRHLRLCHIFMSCFHYVSSRC